MTVDDLPEKERRDITLRVKKNGGFLMTDDGRVWTDDLVVCQICKLAVDSNTIVFIDGVPICRECEKDMPNDMTKHLSPEAIKRYALVYVNYDLYGSFDVKLEEYYFDLTGELVLDELVTCHGCGEKFPLKNLVIFKYSIPLCKIVLKNLLIICQSRLYRGQKLLQSVLKLHLTTLDPP